MSEVFEECYLGETAVFVTFTEEILNGKLSFFVQWIMIDTLSNWSLFQINPLFFPYLLSTSENQRFSGVFQGV